MLKCSHINVLLFLLLLLSCAKDKVTGKYITEYVIIVVIDGPRYSETWGDPSHTYIPYQSALASEGVLFTNFKNKGITYTVPGHTALTTGVYESIDNNGAELPQNPSIFQAWRQEYSTSAESTWLICSKGKLAVLANCTNSSWNNQFMPSANCGIDGAGVTGGKREDSLTFIEVIATLNEHHPNIALINFREPDFSAHQNNWPAYTGEISKTDAYVQQLWEFIENDPEYKGKTTLLITNDHGRHLDGVGNGFAGHGDDCQGCEHISLLALGPDFPGNRVITKEYEQIDVASTIAHMLNFRMPKS
ncbi:MAG: hypothetical protein ACI837_003465, partial [Crocinitomicaceae bacterium]